MFFDSNVHVLDAFLHSLGFSSLLFDYDRLQTSSVNFCSFISLLNFYLSSSLTFCSICNNSHSCLVFSSIAYSSRSRDARSLTCLISISFYWNSFCLILYISSMILSFSSFTLLSVLRPDSNIFIFCSVSYSCICFLSAYTASLISCTLVSYCLFSFSYSCSNFCFNQSSLSK